MNFKDILENIDIAKANVDFILLDAQTNHKLNETERTELGNFYNTIHAELTKVDNSEISKSLIKTLSELTTMTHVSDDELIKIFLESSKILDSIISFAMEENTWEESIVDIRSFETNLTNDLTKQKEELAKQEAEEKIKIENLKNKEYLLFELNEVKYTVGLNDIQEIIVFPESITKIPGTDDVVLGVTNQRGEVIPLIDMRLLFKTKTKEEIEYSKEDIVLTVKSTGGKMVGLIVDKVITVTKIHDDNISEDVPSTEIPKEYLSGLTHKSNCGNEELDNSTIVLLNVGSLLKTDKLELMIKN